MANQFWPLPAGQIGNCKVDPEEQWSTENRGKPINQYWLRDKLRGLIDPPGVQKWWWPENEPRAKQKCERGYLRSQFTRSWNVYLAEYIPEDREEEQPQPSATSASSGTSAPDPSISADLAGADAVEPQSSATANIEENRQSGADVPDEADVADAGAGDTSPSPKPRHARRPKPAKLNGAATEPPAPPRRRNGPLHVVAVRDLRRKYPGWNPEQVAKYLGQPLSRINLVWKRTDPEGKQP